jgi:hypothetical protein
MIDRNAGNSDRVLALTRQIMERRETQKDAVGMSWVLEFQADAEIAVGRPRRGLKLAAAAARMRSEYGGGAPPPLLDLEDPRELVTGELSDETIDELWSEGQQMTIEEALAYARKDGGVDE